MAAHEREGNGEREIAEYLGGDGWIKRREDWERKIDNRLAEGEKRFERLEKRGEEHANGLLRLDGRITDSDKKAGSRHAEVLGALEALRPDRPRQKLRSYREDDDEITSVGRKIRESHRMPAVAESNLALLEERATVQRERAERAETLAEAYRKAADTERDERDAEIAKLNSATSKHQRKLIMILLGALLTATGVGGATYAVGKQDGAAEQRR